MEELSHLALLTLGIALMAGVLCQSIARHIKFPAIVLLLGAGAALGPEGIGWVQPDSLGVGLFALVEIGIAIILFEGGLNLQASRLRRQERTIRYLVTIGALVTLLGAALAVRFVLGWNWQLSFLFGSLVVVTGPTVVTPLLRDMRLTPRLKTILEAEGVLIDPIGAILATLVLQIVLAPVALTIGMEALRLGYRLGFGIVAGVLGGLFLGGALKVRRVVPSGLENIFALSFVVLLFTSCEAVISASGIMAVTVAGVVVGWMGTLVDRELREFKDQLTVLLIGMLFILLSADVSLEDVRHLGWGAAVVLLLLIVVVRPACAAISTARSGMKVRERIFIGLVAPRGIVAAAIVSLTADALTRNGFQGAAELRGLVFVTIAGTVVAAGVTSRPLASLLKLRLPGRNRVAILGAAGLGLTLAEQLRKAGVPVVFLDSDAARCKIAQQNQFTVVYGDALKERTMMRAQFELVGTAIGVTPNDHLNSLFVGHAREYFEVPQGFVAVDTLKDGKRPTHVVANDAEILFEGPHDAERWDVRYRHGDITIRRFRYSPPAARRDAVVEAGTSWRQRELFVLLTHQRNGKAQPMNPSIRLKPDDETTVAIYGDEVDAAIKELSLSDWELMDEVEAT